ncbi:MAG: precorrin-6y C5,15-methyltransferase (decarboxylating) subunit CbiE [Rhodospirillaceae bacterium]|jgi:precorrin-6B C5,15-methyltransferase / cobalt-precorrin-6B C5,C15-methyltransferase|nr:precorrin-6y C5,15-methyltransferase (decarboxylating) subunit CbiE [Rhodospirillaceae bacterium]MBT4686768.1 precorrin-6y C5,15-methyltransferase (decarboxylating) subunit CbiE [Rhodospirillaceae bacterium]MBT5082445.1 precorrin-6y C5,15-methyltransferase (decarboxylating) subunit CbiE [Rhodospirillaceae bacterium]MBT5524018.1 precorrin-6y C5,15-methyltransferase (decarboxylating) subunit CbiE [Rhodospirillaceae bacterium]MBT5882519.1 precorrin-6y C5,15-methyltransferase (decarboxylating) s
MTTPWLSIIGIGEEGLPGLNQAARAGIDGAEIFVGGARHLAMLGDDPRPRMTWDSPLQETMAKIKALKGQAVCVLASGDPMSYGIGVTLSREIGLAQCLVIPHQSAFSLACARLGWPLAEVDCLTLHGRPLGLLHLHLRPNARLLILSEDGKTPKQVAAMLKANGYGNSTITVFEHMGGAKERRHDGTARTWRRNTADLNTIAVDCRIDPDTVHLMRTAGLADEVYQHDGQITKREVRAVTIAALSPRPGEVFWDVGAGAGSIAIEFLRAEPTAQAIAIEQNPKRIANIIANGENLGAGNLRVVAGSAPAALKGLAKPNVIFIGGGVSDAKVLNACWRALGPNGRLIANGITMEAEAQLFAFMQRHGGGMTRIAISHLDGMGDLHAWRAMQAVSQYRGQKP